MDKQRVIIYSDGSSKYGTSTGPGGYGTIVSYLDDDKNVTKEVEYTEGFKVTTNNRMELMGVIIGIESLEEPCDITIVSDSKYVIDAFNKGWISSWKINGWKTSTGKDVKNKDLWDRLLEAIEPHECEFEWIKGHNGHPKNERCDYLANSSANGIIFHRKKDGTLTSDLEELEEDSESTKVEQPDPAVISLVDLSDNTFNLTLSKHNGEVVYINNIKFIVDEGQLILHPEEDKDKAKKEIDALKSILNQDQFKDLFKFLDFNVSGMLLPFSF